MKSLPRKPFYSSTTIIILLPLLILFLNVVSISYFGMKTIDENRIDKVFHILGAISIYFSGAGILWHLLRRKILELQDAVVFRMLVFGFVCFTMICWEIFEYILNIEPEYLTYTDTIADMICGLIGGLVGILFIRRPVG